MLQYTQNRAAEQQSLLMLWNLSYSSRKTADTVVTLNDVLFQNSLLVWSLQLHPGLQNYSQHCHSQSLHCRPLAPRSTSNLFDLTTAVCDMTVLPVESSLLACCVVSNANLACVWLCRRLEAKRQISIYISCQFWSEASRHHLLQHRAKKIQMWSNLRCSTFTVANNFQAPY